MSSTRIPGALRVVEGLTWRYRKYLEPHVVLHRNPAVYIDRCFRNSRARQAVAPIAYVCANPSNAGDYASNLGVRHLTGLPGVEMFCDPAAVPATLRRLRAGPRPGAKWAAVFIGGGGLLQECFDPFWRGLVEIDVPFVLFGVGANEARPVRQVTADGLLVRIARSATALHVRDEFTHALLAGKTATPVTLGICPAVNYLTALTQPTKPARTHLLHVIHEADLRLAGADLPSQWRASAQLVAAQLGLTYDEIDHMGGFDPAMMTRYARAAAVVSSRLHGCIFAHALQTPFVAVDCDRKVRGFVDTHVPGTPCIDGSDPDRLSAAHVSAALSQPYARSYESAVRINRVRMAQILEPLGLCS